MSARKRMILHIGGPKCGSSALQAALSATPDLTSQSGEKLSYTGLRGGGGKDWRPIQGRLLTTAAQRSVHGYVSWPNLGRTEDPTPIFDALDKVWSRLRPGTVPVLSNEGWVGQAEAFAERLPHWFTPGSAESGAPLIEIQAFARPPLDWLNSAYWQWGVWNTRNFDSWLERLAMPYQLGTKIAQWAALPNTRLHLHLSGDVVARFGEDHGVALRPAQARNSSLSPAMVGFLLRNRRFRPTAHDSAAEFIFQRWCDTSDAPRLWALMPRHVQAVKQAARAEVETLFSLLPEDQRRALRQSDPRWTSNEPYHAKIRAGRSKLDDPEQLAQLYVSLCDGVRKAAHAIRQPVPPLASALAASAPIEDWDTVVASALEHLVKLDRHHRRSKWKPRGWPFRRADGETAD